MIFDRASEDAKNPVVCTWNRGEFAERTHRPQFVVRKLRERTQSPTDQRPEMRRSDPIAVWSNSENAPNEPNAHNSWSEICANKPKSPTDQRPEMRRMNPSHARGTRRLRRTNPGAPVAGDPKLHERTRRMQVELGESAEHRSGCSIARYSLIRETAR